ncbi:MAG: hypothetical protein CVV49_20485 [Spirochaetae bacterium HGW-Spirochaetae-5]|nr:MAG: hypothetical protein CVV49_20485 [Spirochaetae bacterium HGW-Spirochaetae-5]
MISYSLKDYSRRFRHFHLRIIVFNINTSANENFLKKNRYQRFFLIKCALNWKNKKAKKKFRAPFLKTALNLTISK